MGSRARARGPPRRRHDRRLRPLLLLGHGVLGREA